MIIDRDEDIYFYHFLLLMFIQHFQQLFSAFNFKSCWIMFTYKFFLYNCDIYIIKFANILLNDLWNLCNQNVVLFWLVSHIVLTTMKWQMF